jgi:hypothetical protein
MDNQMKFEFAASEPTFTYTEYSEIMGWRIARMKEAGETIPSGGLRQDANSAL